MSANTGVKRILIAGGAVFVVAAGVALVQIFAPQPASPKRGVETTFLDFTNTPIGPCARFAVTYGRRFRGWSWRESITSHRRADGTWEVWAGADNRNTYRFIDSRSPPTRTRDGKEIHTVLELPVENTNAVWRIVLNVDESPPWPPWPVMMAQRLKALVSKPRHQTLGPDQHYFLTNQTIEMK
jgi:hypothetical protein